MKKFFILLALMLTCGMQGITAQNKDYDPGNPNSPGQVFTLTMRQNIAGLATYVVGQDDPYGVGHTTLEVKPNEDYSAFTTQVSAGTSISIEAQHSSAFTLDSIVTDKGKRLEFTDVLSVGTVHTKMPTRNVALTFYYSNALHPDVPGQNMFDNATGCLSLDFFKPGTAYSTLRSLPCLADGNFRKVKSLVVAGRITDADYDLLMDALHMTQFTAIEKMDFSRTAGGKHLPEFVFYHLENLQEVVLPEDIRTIDASAFNGCPLVSTLTIFAMTPPEVTDKKLWADRKDFVIRVPEDAIPLYKDHEVWGRFDIQPITDDAYSLQVSLPADCADGRCKGQYIELLNHQTGGMRQYVVTDRLDYVFHYLPTGSLYTVRLMDRTTSDSVVCATLPNIVIDGKNETRTFSNIHYKNTLQLKVLDPDGVDVTQYYRYGLAVWTRNSNGERIAADTQCAWFDGEEVTLTLTNQTYMAAYCETPEPIVFTFPNESGEKVVKLPARPTFTLKGVVMDADSHQPLRDVQVVISQSQNKSTAFTTTDSYGRFQQKLFVSPIDRITYNLENYGEMWGSVGDINTLVQDGVLQADTMLLKYGYTCDIELSYAYQKAVDKLGEPNDSTVSSLGTAVRYKATNLSKGHDIAQLQQGLMGVTIRPGYKNGKPLYEAGDTLRLTGTSLKKAFEPFTLDVVLDDRCNASGKAVIIQNGTLKASFRSTENSEVVGMLFDGDGHLLQRANYNGATIQFEELPSGHYTLISLASDPMFNSFNQLSQLAQLGLKANVDYVRNDIDMQKGLNTQVVNPFIPRFDTSRTKFLSDNAYINLNSTPHIGSYATVYASTEFAEAYRNGISDVKLLVSMPNGVKFVKGSAMTAPVGADNGQIIKNTDYDEEQSLLIVPLDNPSAAITPLTRFCVIPNDPGQHIISANVSFTLNGQQYMQPLGSITMNFDSGDLSMYVNKTFTEPKFSVTGEVGAPYLRKGTVKVYDDGTLVGTARVGENGRWSTTCQLKNPINMSMHNIYAVLELNGEVTVRTDVTTCIYNRMAQRLRRVTMYHYNAESKANQVNVFDYYTHANPGGYRVDGTDNDYSFTIDFEKNDTALIKNVVLDIYCKDGEIRSYPAQWSEARQCWTVLAKLTMGTRPENVGVDFQDLSDVAFDDENTYAEITSLLEESARMSAFFKAIGEAERNGQEISDEEMAELARQFGIPYTPDVETDEEPTLPDDWEPTDFSGMTDEEIEAHFNQLFSDFDATLQRTETMMNQADLLTWDDLALKMSPDADTSIMPDLRVYLGSCEGIDILKLKDEGYELTLTTIGDTLYTLRNDKFEDLVWPGRNLRMTITYTDEESAMVKGMTMLNIPPPAADNGYNPWDNLVDDVKTIVDGFTSLSLEKFLSAFSTLCTRLYDVAAKSIAACETLLRDMPQALMKPIVEMRMEIKFATEQLGKLQKEYNNMLKAGNVSPQLLAQCEKKLLQGSGAISSLTKRLKIAEKAAGWIKKLIFPIVDKLAFKILDKMMTFGFSALDAAKWELEAWDLYCDVPEKCPEEQSKADYIHKTLTGLMIGRGIAWAGDFAASLALSSTKFTGLIASVPTLGTSLIPTIAVILVNIAKDLVFGAIYKHYDNEANKLADLAWSLKCTTDMMDPEHPDRAKKKRKFGSSSGDGGPHKGGGVGSLIDPSGYIYEAVSSNRIEGATATLYEKNTTKDMYGDPIEIVTQWDAEQFDQVNPQQTNAEGRYRWDVPEGMWQVRINKDGYDNQQSEWLPVPPPQLDVNMPIVNRQQPFVNEARAYDDGAEISFSKYMDPVGFVPRNITLIAVKDGVQTKVSDVEILPLDAEAVSKADTTTYATKWSVRTATDLSQMDEAILTISPLVTSYCGAQMREAYSQHLDIERRVKQLTNDSIYNVAQEQKTTVRLAALPAEAVKGRSLLITSASEDMLRVSDAAPTFDENGEVEFQIEGLLAGTSGLQFAVEGTTFTTASVINVVDSTLLNQELVAPKASRVSGTYVYAGQTVALTTDNEGVTIYYTTDGSCPCDAATRKKYTGPIVITDEMTIRAMAVGINGQESETSVFTYKIRTTDMSLSLKKGWNWVSHNQDAGLQTSAFATGVERIVGKDAESNYDAILGMVGGLDMMQPEQSYKVLAQNDKEYQMGGTEYNPSAHYISLDDGWNWVGYPVTQAMSMAEALLHNDMAEGDVMASQDGFAEWVDGQWIGTLQMLAPGKGYMLKSNGQKRIAYNNAIVSNVKAFVGRSLTPSLDKTWAPDKYRYPNTMNIVGQIIDAAPSASDRYTVAAFADEECRGVGQWIGDRVFLTVYGEKNEPITFYALDNDEQTVVELFTSNVTTNYATEPFVSDMQGSYNAPYAFSLGMPTGITVTEQGLHLVPAAVYTLSGIKMDAPKRGFNILRYGDGRTRKAIVK